jgi:hypothetical protein
MILNTHCLRRRFLHHGAEKCRVHKCQRHRRACFIETTLHLLKTTAYLVMLNAFLLLVSEWVKCVCWTWSIETYTNPLRHRPIVNHLQSDDSDPFFRPVVSVGGREKGVTKGKIDDPLVPKQLEDAITIVGIQARTGE